MNFTVVEDANQISPTQIKVIGVGGGGSNAVNRMIEADLAGVDFVAVNTDQQALHRSLTQNRIAIGQQVTNGLGAGGDPGVGEKAALEDKETIKEMLGGCDMVFITAGMGGGTGTGAAPVIAQLSKEMGILTVAVVTKPFKVEGRKKLQLAEEGIERLREHVDTVLVIPNQNLFNIVERKTTIKDAFRFADDILRQGVQGISDLITKTGLINIDFADVRTVMKGKGDALMGIGSASGENRATEAANGAMNNPLLEDAHIDGAQSILVNVRGDENLTLEEYEEIVRMITSAAHEDALVIIGTAVDESLGETIEVTLVATGFEHGFHGQAKGSLYDSVLGGERKGAERIPPKQGTSFGQRSASSPSSLGYGKGSFAAEKKSARDQHGEVFKTKVSPVVVTSDDLSIPTYYRMAKNQG